MHNYNYLLCRALGWFYLNNLDKTYEILVEMIFFSVEGHPEGGYSNELPGKETRAAADRSAAQTHGRR